jgi:NAD(P)-dependent dehydrogenase (short-subunit alcohol dehydrogenase family)
MTTLAGKVVAVTGAASGMGRALVRALAARGAHVALADVDAGGMRESARLIEADRAKAQQPASLRISMHVVDVREHTAMERYASEVKAQHGGVDVLISNAGLAVLRHFDKLTLDQLELVLDVNLWGVIHGIRAFLPLLRERPEGHIVNIGSVNAFVPFPQNSAYNMSKFAVLGLSETLMQELADEPIRVTVVHPGAVRTNLVRNASGFTTAQAAYFDKVARTSSETAAEAILKAIERNKQHLLIGRDAWFMSWAKRLFPRWIVRYVGRYTQPKTLPRKAADRAD